MKNKKFLIAVLAIFGVGIAFTACKQPVDERPEFKTGQIHFFVHKDVEHTMYTANVQLRAAGADMDAVKDKLIAVFREGNFATLSNLWEPDRADIVLIVENSAGYKIWKTIGSDSELYINIDGLFNGDLEKEDGNILSTALYNLRGRKTASE